MDATLKAELIARYQAALHGMQTGVAYEMQHDAKATQPKHLRVGVNAAMVDHSALAKLMMDKGIITEEEYYRALVAAMEAERDRYELHLTRTLGISIKLR